VDADSKAGLGGQLHATGYGTDDPAGPGIRDSEHKVISFRYQGSQVLARPQAQHAAHMMGVGWVQLNPASIRGELPEVDAVQALAAGL